MNRYYIIGVLMLLFASCGRQHEAQTVVKDFMEDCLHRDVSYLDFSDVDSTRVISDSVLQAMRQRAAKDVSYEERKGKTLLHIRANYVLDGDTCSTTFYLNPGMTGVVAFKEN